MIEDENNFSGEELATLNWYEWEIPRGRGWMTFDYPVDLESPYVPFEHIQAGHFEKSIDDGVAPSLFSKFRKWASVESKAPKVERASYFDLVASPSPDREELVGFQLSFLNQNDIEIREMLEFLNVLSYSAQSISFEILATHSEVKVLLTCRETDIQRFQNNISLYLPDAIIQAFDPYGLPFDAKKDIAVADYGLESEFMQCIETEKALHQENLTPLFAVLNNLQEEEVVLFQVIFQGANAPWSQSIRFMSEDASGRSFFSDNPDMPRQAQIKTSQALYACVVRTAIQSKVPARTEYLVRQTAYAIAQITKSHSNRLIPLSNEGYDFDLHMANVFFRESHRIGMLLNAHELLSLAHFPVVASEKLNGAVQKTKSAPGENLSGKHFIGTNLHANVANAVYLSDENKTRHAHIIGATGSGKSNFLVNVILEDIKNGNGISCLDPHGDLVDDILLRLPAERRDDVILIDPSDGEYSIGLNLLQATNDAERIVLSSDLVSAFKAQASAWGDRMTSVLANAVDAFTMSSNQGTLLELKRFLIEDDFRKEFLESVKDQSIHYYWRHEYPMVQKGIAPLLTRIDTFLRPRIIRYMFAQKEGIDFKKAIDSNSVLLIKLSQGLIGRENSYLLGTIILSKLYQSALSRASMDKKDRLPHTIYIDEFQNYVTPSISSILEGARKYGLGLVLAHQNLKQIADPQVLDSVIANPFTRVCFRLGDADAKTLEDGFSYFDASDLSNLEIGQAIVRIGKSSQDFNLSTEKMTDEVIIDQPAYIIDRCRNLFGKPRAEVEAIIEQQLPKIKPPKKKKEEAKSVKQLKEVEEKPKSNPIAEAIQSDSNTEDLIIEPKNKEAKNPNIISGKERDQLIKDQKARLEQRDHTYLQSHIKKLGQDRGFLASVEKEVSQGRIDVALERDNIKMAFEITITNTPEYEIKNIRKCLSAGYLPVIVVSKDGNHLKNVENYARKEMKSDQFKLVQFILPSEISNILDSVPNPKQTKTDIIKGYKVTTNYTSGQTEGGASLREHIVNLLLKK